MAIAATETANHITEYDRMAALKQFNFEQFEHTPLRVQRPLHESAALLIALSGGEGSGKSKSTAAEVAARYPTWSKVLFVAYKSESAQNEAAYLDEMLRHVGAVKKYSHPKGGNIEMTFANGAWLHSVTTHSEGASAVTGTGKEYEIICMLEAGKQRYEVFQACMTRASRTGATLILSGTIERAEPWFPSLLLDLQKPELAALYNAQVIIMPAWENELLYPGGLNDPKIIPLRHVLGEALFNERLGGQPSIPDSIIFKEFSFLKHVHTWCEFDPNVPVQLAIDPGYSGSHYSVNAIQEHPRAYTRMFAPWLPDLPLMDVWVIDDIYAHHAVHEQVIIECQKRPWWRKVVGGVGDVIMKSHPMADRAPVDVWKQKANIFLRAQPVGIEDGIDRHHTLLASPHPVAELVSPRLFYNPRVTGAPQEYGRWEREEVGQLANGEIIYGAPSVHNCDALKALNYYFIDRFKRVERQKPERPHVVGQRVTLAHASQDILPAMLGAPPLRTTDGNPRQRRSNYVVVPRKIRSN